MYVKDEDLPLFGFAARVPPNLVRKLSAPIVPDVPSINRPLVVRYPRRGLNATAPSDFCPQRAVAVARAEAARRAQARAGQRRGIEGLSAPYDLAAPPITELPISTVLSPSVTEALKRTVPTPKTDWRTAGLELAQRTGREFLEELAARRAAAATATGSRVEQTPVFSAGPPPAAPSQGPDTWTKIKDFLLQEKIGDVPNWMLVGGAVAIITAGALKGRKR